MNPCLRLGWTIVMMSNGLVDIAGQQMQVVFFPGRLPHYVILPGLDLFDQPGTVSLPDQPDFIAYCHRIGEIFPIQAEFTDDPALEAFAIRQFDIVPLSG